MKAGITVEKLIERVAENQVAKHDLVAPARLIRLVEGPNVINRLQVEVDHESGGVFNVSDVFLRQMGARLNINANYFDYMRAEAPELLRTNTNHWLGVSDKRHMVRTLKGNARAMLSDGYKIVDNEVILAEMLPALAAIDGIRIMECELTENRMYIKAVTPRIQGDVKVGDTVQAGLVISNGEIGNGALSVTPLIYQLKCLNGLILPAGRFRAFHVGRKHSQEDAEVFAMLTDETKKAEDKALLLKARDIAKNIFTQEHLNSLIAPMQEAAGTPVATKRPDMAVEVLANTIGLNDGEQIAVLTHLLQGGDLTRWGFISAVTRAAQDVEDYDRSVQLEALGGTMLNLPAKEWKALEKAA